MLTAEVTPKLDTADWSFRVEGLAQNPTAWTWDEIHALPASVYEGDIHCVTTWSKLGMTFSGVSIDTLLEIAKPLSTATHVMAFSHTGYTTNLPIEDVTGGRAWVAWEVEGAPLPRDHGRASHGSNLAAEPGLGDRLGSAASRTPQAVA